MLLTKKDPMLSKVRRNFSQIATMDFGRTILEDISASSICRSEIKTAATLIASARLFFAHLHASLLDVPSSGKHTHVLHVSFRQDATNGRPKKCTLELDVAWSSFTAESLAQGADWNTESYRIRRTSDVLPVADESGAGCLAFTLKALKSLGCPTWLDFKDSHWKGYLVLNLVEQRGFLKE